MQKKWYNTAGITFTLWSLLSILWKCAWGAVGIVGAIDTVNQHKMLEIVQISSIVNWTGVQFFVLCASLSFLLVFNWDFILAYVKKRKAAKTRNWNMLSLDAISHVALLSAFGHHLDGKFTYVQALGALQEGFRSGRIRMAGVLSSGFTIEEIPLSRFADCDLNMSLKTDGEISKVTIIDGGKKELYKAVYFDRSEVEGTWPEEFRPSSTSWMGV